MIDELNELLNPSTMPLLKRGRAVHYEGSIDKTGGNADWDWELYRQSNGESVLFEQYGAGCILNFVQHRYLSSPEPTFRFYFDGEKKPRFTIRPSEFGEKYPFIPPIADKFIGPERDGQVIRVVRSFVPMPFTTYCKITSDVALFGNAAPGGGWGHVIYHCYADDTPVSSFTPTDVRYRQLAAFWSECGRNPLKATEAQRTNSGFFTLAPGEEKKFFSDDCAGTVTALRLRTENFDRTHLKDLFLRARFDGHGKEDLALPVGCLFGNELGYHRVSYLFSGGDGEGGFYCFFPMPYFSSAEFSLENRGGAPIGIEELTVEHTREYNRLYTPESAGYFMNAPYYERKHTPGADSLIADISDVSGQVISSTITGYSGKSGWADCEGDVRVHFDGIHTPQVESDGSESYSCYGWGFCSPPQCNPVSGYDGREADRHRDWSMVRHLPGDCYPFYGKLHFGIESFGHNDADREMYHSGAVFFYGHRRTEQTLLCKIERGKEELTSFFEGDEDHIAWTLRGNRGEKMEISLPAKDLQCAREIVLRRVSDQKFGRQMAKVFVCGTELSMPWYAPDHNSFKRFLEDEYVIPVKDLPKEGDILIAIEPQKCGGMISFNQFGIEVYRR